MTFSGVMAEERPWVRLAVAVAVCGVVSCAAAADAVRCAPIFGDRMVVQREQAVPVWGVAPAGAAVEVTFAGQVARGVAAADGRWQVMLMPLAASVEPRNLTIAAAGERLTFADVVVGDVWLCAGQSNMAWPVDRSTGFDAVKQEAPLPLLRHAAMWGKPAAGEAASRWEACAPDTVGRFSAVAHAFGRHLHRDQAVPIGLVVAAVSGTQIEMWIGPEALATVSAGPLPRKGKPSSLSDMLIAPLMPMAMKGVAWYQGESNVVNAEQYEQLLTTLITDWRGRWREAAPGRSDQPLPFFIVQVSNYGPVVKKPAESRLAQLREAQAKVAAAVGHSGLAVAIDGDGDIHPKDKRTIGERLARLALANTYGTSIAANGPVLASVRRDGAAMMVTFDHADSGLVTADGQPPRHFAVAGADRVFYAAEAVIDGKAVRVSAATVPEPVAVRYAWADNPRECNLVNADALPAVPFRTDDWH